MTPDPAPGAPDVPERSSSAEKRVDFHRRGTGRPTMLTVSEVAGVSMKTVSRVFNGEPGVRPHTAERVRRAAQQLGYRRNDAASALARAQPQNSIGLIIEDLSDPFYSQLTRGVQEVAQQNGYLVLLSSSEENSVLERSATLALASRGVSGMRGVSGLIVVPHSDDHAYLSDDIEAGLSVVFVDRPAVNLAADSVLSDNVEGARSAVEHLIGLGHRRIAFIGNERNVYTSAGRLRGYEDAHARAGIAVDGDLIVLGPRTDAESGQAVDGLLRLTDPPTAIFTQNNVLTLGAWRAVRDAGVTVPIMGFDDFAVADLLVPPVSVVVQDPVALGRRAAELLFSRLAGAVHEPRTVVVPTHLVIRG